MGVPAKNRRAFFIQTTFTMKKYFWFSLILACCLSQSFAQKGKEKKLQSAIFNAFKKAYPSSVRVWGYDTLRNERTSAQFSAVVVSPDGYILTAAHTVEPGKTYKVFFTDGKEAIAKALGKIEVKETPGSPDMGMMKILTPGKWPFAQMGHSDLLRADELALSISYPESLNQPLPSLRVGKIAEQKNEYGFIRSTCKMEPGDSGGPLFDGAGKVIGLHSAIDVSEEMNFEVPVDLYRKYWTALLQPVLYTAWPEQRNEEKQQAMNDAKVNFLDFSAGFELKIKNVYLMISSYDDDSKVMATLFNVETADGKIVQVLLSKSTLVGKASKLQYDGREIPLKIISRDQDNDLVLLSAEQKIAGGINLKLGVSNVNQNPIGHLLFSVSADGKAQQSVRSTATLSLAKKASLPYLGAMVVYNSSPAVFSLIKEGSPAALAGLKVGDELISIHGVQIKSSTELATAIGNYWPEDEVELRYNREGRTLSTLIKFKGHDQASFNHPAEKFAGGKSIRRDGFQLVEAHDLALKPMQVGSPIFDAEGNFVAINIARFSRTTSLMLARNLIQDFISTSLNGKK